MAEKYLTANVDKNHQRGARMKELPFIATLFWSASSSGQLSWRRVINFFSRPVALWWSFGYVSRLRRNRSQVPGANPGLFLIILVNSKFQLTDKYIQDILLPMLGFEPQISGVRSDCSANCATDSAQFQLLTILSLSIRGRKKWLPGELLLFSSNRHYKTLAAMHTGLMSTDGVSKYYSIESLVDLSIC